MIHPRYLGTLNGKPVYEYTDRGLCWWIAPPTSDPTLGVPPSA